jgi:hypothetical protein
MRYALTGTLLAVMAAQPADTRGERNRTRNPRMNRCRRFAPAIDLGRTVGTFAEEFGCSLATVTNIIAGRSRPVDPASGDEVS